MTFSVSPLGKWILVLVGCGAVCNKAKKSVFIFKSLLNLYVCVLYIWIRLCIHQRCRAINTEDSKFAFQHAAKNLSLGARYVCNLLLYTQHSTVATTNHTMITKNVLNMIRGNIAITFNPPSGVMRLVLMLLGYVLYQERGLLVLFFT